MLAAPARPSSVPERLGMLGIGVAVAAAVWPSFTGLTGVGLPCPLRTLTGIPCPLCGMTTASVALVRGDVAGAMAANPFVLLLAALTLVMAAVMLLRAIGRFPTAGPWSAAATRLAVVFAAAAAIVSEAWQLHRVL